MTVCRYVAVVDDDASICRSLARLLQLSGFQVITFDSAEQFLVDPLRAHFGFGCAQLGVVLVDLPRRDAQVGDVPQD